MHWFKNISTYAIIIYISLVCAEGMFFIYQRIQSTGLNYDPPGKAVEQRRARRDEEIRKDFLRSNPEYSGVLYPNLFVKDTALTNLALKHSFLPLGHAVPNSPIVFCNEGYGLVTYTSDRYGFHNADEVWEAERPWLLVGDSFVHGSCVHTQHNIAARLEETSGDTVINLGSISNGPAVYVGLVRVFLELTRPKKVVLFFYINDFNDPSGSIYVSQTALFSPYSSGDFPAATRAFYEDIEAFLDTERLRFIAQEKSEGLGEIIQEMLLNRFFGRVQLLLTLTELRKGISRVYQQNNYVQLAIETAAKECGKFDPGCDVIVVYIPPSQYFRPTAQHIIDSQLAYLWKVKEGIERSIKLVDLSGVLDRSSYAPEGHHLSVEGYRLVADRILRDVD